MSFARVDQYKLHNQRGLRFSRLRIVMFLCLLDLVAVFLVLLQAFGLNLVFLVPILQPIVFLLVLTTMQRLSRAASIPLFILGLLTAVSLLKAFSLTGVVDYNFTYRSVIAYFYSIALPCLLFSTILSQRENNPDIVYNELKWFSRWFVILSVPLILIYFFLHVTGRFVYFGFSINFHYAAPFFFHKNMYTLGMAVLILLSGKRAVLVNFLVQLGLYFSAELRRNPFPVLIFIIFATVATIFAGDNLAFLLRRFEQMADTLRTADWSEGLFGIADTYDSIILFGGRLEEITGVLRYFEKYPNQIWFGAPPGANYLWKIEWSDMSIYKSFAHLTWVAYIFRYGIIPSLFLLAFLIYLLFRRPEAKGALWLVYVGTLSSATFGPNLLGSPTAWILIALYFRYGPMKAKKRLRNSKAIAN
ncbi:hypothetical protein [Sulfitobacter sp. 1A12779]|uniref:hypothetical protein n=1 Tax=Sulfitobacter sp. 1A12779 TaxID=3368599 RepID=UPI0037477D57